MPTRNATAPGPNCARARNRFLVSNLEYAGKFFESGKSWHARCNIEGVRVTPKSVQGSATAPQRASEQPPRQSFIDALTSVSSVPVRRIDATHSEDQRSSEERPKESTDNQDQNSSSTQAAKIQGTSNKAQQSGSVSQSTQEADWKREQSADSASSETGTQGTSVRKSDGSSSKNAAFTGQVASQFILQASTTLPDLTGVFALAAPAIEAGDRASKADSPKQSTDGLTTNPISDQGTELQGQPGATGSIAFAGQKNLRAGQESDAEEASDTLKAARTGAGQTELELACTDQASDSKNPENVATQLTAPRAGVDVNGMAASDPAGMLQASLAADTQKASTVDGNPNQAALKALQSKVTGSAFGLNSNAGDAAKTDKSGDAREDRPSLLSADMSSPGALSTQPGSAHVGGRRDQGQRCRCNAGDCCFSTGRISRCDRNVCKNRFRRNNNSSSQRV